VIVTHCTIDTLRNVKAKVSQGLAAVMSGCCPTDA
jgi:hypothetical protein